MQNWWPADFLHSSRPRRTRNYTPDVPIRLLTWWSKHFTSLCTLHIHYILYTLYPTDTGEVNSLEQRLKSVFFFFLPSTEINLILVILLPSTTPPESTSLSFRQLKIAIKWCRVECVEKLQYILYATKHCSDSKIRTDMKSEYKMLPKRFWKYNSWCLFK